VVARVADGFRVWTGVAARSRPEGAAGWPQRVACELLARPRDEAVARVLELLALAAEADRAWILEYSPDLAVFRNTHEWCRSGVTSHLADLQDTPVTLIGAMQAHMVAGDPVLVTDVHAMPPSMRGLQREFLRQSIRSSLTVPIRHAGRLRGAIGFDATREARIWGEDVVAAMLLVAELVAAACHGERPPAPAGTGTAFPPLVYLRTGRSVRGVRLDALAMLRADGDQSIAHLTDGTMVTDLRPLKWWHTVLPPGRFVRIHRSAIVQIRCICGLTRQASGGWRVRIDGTGDSLSVSRKMLPDLRSRLGL